MRKTILALAVPALLFGTVAAEEAKDFSPCGDDLDHPVLAVGDSLTENPTEEGIAAQFYVDPTATERGRVSVQAHLEWEIQLSDWDLDVNGTLSENAQPVDAPVEDVTYSARGDCKLVTVIVYPFNVWGTPPTGTMTLDITVA